MLSIYALHQGLLLLLFLRAQRRPPGSPGSRGASSALPANGAAHLPSVMVQVPLYNERFVAQRIIDALCQLDYPRPLLHIQILDDSTDDTTRIAQSAVDLASASGVSIELIHREHRDGFKGGALANGMRASRGEYIAIFDADFVPPPDFLRRIFVSDGPFTDPSVGFVQTRWGYLNRDDSALTRAQALLLDMHFVIDQTARSAWRLPMNFNGSAGVWRRACIEDAGGWQFDTLTEDLDLSYRAELRGWLGVYRLDMVSPSELPGAVVSFKRQQARWARGTVQCMRKLAPRVLDARSHFGLGRKLAAFMHLSGYMTYPLLLLLAFSSPLLAIETYGQRVMPSWMSLVSLVGLLPMLSMFMAHWQQGRGPGSFVRDLPVAVMLGIGLTWSNTAAMLAGLVSKASGVFTRTPKVVSGIVKTDVDDAARAHKANERRSVGAYTEVPDWTVVVEFCLALYVLGVCWSLAQLGEWIALFPLLLYGFSFAGVALSQFVPMARSALRQRAASHSRGDRTPSPTTPSNTSTTSAKSAPSSTSATSAQPRAPSAK